MQQCLTYLQEPTQHQPWTRHLHHHLTPSKAKNLNPEWCWSHGKCYSTSIKCNEKAPGHMEAATQTNQMGSTLPFADPRWQSWGSGATETKSYFNTYHMNPNRQINKYLFSKNKNSLFTSPPTTNTSLALSNPFNQLLLIPVAQGYIALHPLYRTSKI